MDRIVFAHSQSLTHKTHTHTHSPVLTASNRPLHTHPHNSVTHWKQLTSIHWIVQKQPAAGACGCSQVICNYLCWSFGALCFYLNWSNLSLAWTDSLAHKVATVLRNICMLHFQQHPDTAATIDALSSLLAHFLHISKQLLHVDLAVIWGMC